MDRNAFREYFGVSRETLKRLDVYLETLVSWQRRINLVAPKTLDAAWERHFADSTQLARLLPDRPASIVDMGSGAGFPGLVLAILRAEKFAQSAEENVRLFESDQRKAAFLREVSRKTGVRVDVDGARISYDGEGKGFHSVNVVTARALAPMHKLLGYASPFFSADTVGVFPKGRDVEREIEDAQALWSFSYSLVPSVTDEDARIVVVRELTAKS